LLAPRGATLNGLVEVHSHAQGLAQCRERLRSLGLQPIVHPDTAGAAKDIAAKGDKSVGAIASALAGEIYGLDVLLASAEDKDQNTTRFLVMAAAAQTPALNGNTMVTTMVFRLRSVPAALYKALGGFATNGINLTKLESYMRPGFVDHAQFYVDVEGHTDSVPMQNAIEELRFYCEEGEVRILGCYPSNRAKNAGG
jgi:prephenate dehydratase